VIERELVPGGAVLAIAPGARQVVLKRLDEDCLLDGQIHPAIRQRLNRVRELPLVGIANLMGVERIEGVAQLVWEYVPGTPLAEFEGDAAAWGRVTRELMLAVDSLHSAGIVHGSIHERNIIIDDSGSIRLTHVSPLLYTETDQDAVDVIEMLDDLVGEQAEGSPLAQLLGRARVGRWPIGQFYARLMEMGTEPPIPVPEPRTPRFRTGALVAAVIVALLGVLFAAGVLWYVESSPLERASGSELRIASNVIPRYSEGPRSRTVFTSEILHGVPFRMTPFRWVRPAATV
jgi:hypothetical protein